MVSPTSGTAYLSPLVCRDAIGLRLENVIGMKRILKHQRIRVTPVTKASAHGRSAT